MKPCKTPRCDLRSAWRGAAGRIAGGFAALSLLAIAATLATAPAASAQDWCGAGGLNSTERAICGDAVLGALDAELNRVFDDSGMDAPRQARWLRQTRDACGSDIFCIERAYRDRIAALLQSPADRVDPDRRPWCSAASLNEAERAICSDDLLADLDAALGAVYGSLRARSEDASQVAWLRGERDACGSDRDCIAAAYLRRIVVLGGRLRGS
ncbi:hypothetical protein [Profundibacterium mesophilum]|uniref:Exported protein n=1 Tax=Profundibacterium mesophilum KAUST100406-0324 TaxID=1037889 RepID=A0A921TC56_9RHOB|nr:hypothetical protein [Profundibacterium mesophilum]KAF0675283.1 putative exported protein [Profundibacterium mesophilum KAUST100406-0324]